MPFKEPVHFISPAAEGLTQVQIEAIDALISTRSVAAAARAMNLTNGALINWLRIPEFRAELMNRRAIVYEESVDSLKGLMESATQALIDGLESKNINHRLRAADLFFRHFATFRSMEEIDKRLMALEMAQKNSSGKNNPLIIDRLRGLRELAARIRDADAQDTNTGNGEPADGAPDDGGPPTTGSEGPL